MKNQIVQRLALVLNALNSTSVSGKANLANLSGSIAMLEEVVNILNTAEIVTEAENADEKTADK